MASESPPVGNFMKVCALCGRTIEPRKKWSRNWESVKYCSERCRRSKGNPQHEAKILELLNQRASSSSLCPSEVLPLELRKDKSKMEEVRQAARRLVQQGLLVITQKGQIVDPSTAKGPIRLKLSSKGLKV